MLTIKVLPGPLDWICLWFDWSEATSAQHKIIGYSNSTYRKSDQRLRFYIKHANFTFLIEYLTISSSTESTDKINQKHSVFLFKKNFKQMSR